MSLTALAVVNSNDVALFAIFILVTFLCLFGLFIFGYLLKHKPDSVSPYSRLPLRRAIELSYDAKVRVLRFLYDMHQYDNRIFEFKRAAVCRETGRIFTNAITWYGKIDVDWTFLQKRYAGNYVSWGSLSLAQQEVIAAEHDTLEGFQIQFSSPSPQPRLIDAKYAFAQPGPLYVDINSNTLLGWKGVPGTDLEVLVVQKPMKIIMARLDCT